MLSLLSSTVGQPSLVEWVVGILQERGPQTLDELGHCLPDTNWAQLLLAVDYLTRNGHISMDLVRRGDYLVSLSQPEAPSPSQSSPELAATTRT
jgi:hypothetical protein